MVGGLIVHSDAEDRLKAEGVLADAYRAITLSDAVIANETNRTALAPSNVIFNHFSDEEVDNHLMPDISPDLNGVAFATMAFKRMIAACAVHRRTRCMVAWVPLAPHPPPDASAPPLGQLSLRFTGHLRRLGSQELADRALQQRCHSSRTALRVVFDETHARGSDTLWKSALRRLERGPAGAQEPLFFWLCHQKHMSNPARTKRFERSFAELR